MLPRSSQRHGRSCRYTPGSNRTYTAFDKKECVNRDPEEYPAEEAFPELGEPRANEPVSKKRTADSWPRNSCPARFSLVRIPQWPLFFFPKTVDDAVLSSDD